MDKYNMNNEIYYMTTEYEVLKLIAKVKEIQFKDYNLNVKGAMKEGQEGKIVRKYVGKIGIDNMYGVLYLLYKTSKNITIKQIEKEFENKLKSL